MSFHFAPLAAVGLAATGFAAVGVEDAATPVTAPTAYVYAAAEPAAPAPATRYMLSDRMLGTSCLLARSGDRIERLGACRDTFAHAHRIHTIRDRGSRLTLVDAVGSAVLDFEWNEETGMSSTRAPNHPETGRYGLVPVRTASGSYST